MVCVVFCVAAVGALVGWLVRAVVVFDGFRFNCGCSGCSWCFGVVW